MCKKRNDNSKKIFFFDIIGRLQSLINFRTQWKDDITLSAGFISSFFFASVNLIKTSYLLPYLWVVK